MADKKSTPSCDYCEKRGLPILPLRYAIARPQKGAPIVTNKPSINIPDSAGQYTLRILRSGYLNVYDEARKHWDHYFVTPDGYYSKLNTKPGAVIVTPKEPFNCKLEGHREIASCITIPNAKKATNVWLAFSDVQWTEAVQKQHDAADYRKQHMRCVDVKAYAASVDAKHCLPIKDVSSKVIEYALDQSASKKAIGFSPFLADDRKGKSQRLIEECERIAPGKAFAVVVADAAGIAAELDHLMTRSASDFANHRDRKHPLMVSTAILQFKDALYTQTFESEENAANYLADEEERNPYSSFSEKQLEKLRTVTPAQARTATDNAWKTKYRTKFNEDAMEKWQVKFKAEDKDFQEKIIIPLAKALLAWLESTAMKKAFECHYDPNDLACGEVYTRIAHMVIQGAQDKKLCMEHMVKKLSAEFTPDNFLLNATVFNHKSFKEQVKKAVTISLDPLSVPGDAAIGFQTAVTEKIAEGHASALSPYLLSLNAPFIHMFNKAIDGGARPLWTALAMHSGKTFTPVTAVGNKDAFYKKAIKELARASGQTLPEHKLRKAIATEMRRLAVAGVPLSGTQSTQFAMFIDSPSIGAGPAGLSSAANAKRLAGALRTPVQVDAIVFDEWKTALAKPSAIAKGSIPFVGALLAAIWQFHALNKMTEDKNKAMSHEAKEANWRLQAGTLAIWGTLADAAGQGLAKMLPTTPSFGRGLAAVVAKLASKLGLAAGLVGASIMAGWDVVKAVEALQNKQFGMATLYFASSGLGFYIGYLALMGAIPFAGWIAILVLIGIAVLIELFKDNKVQDWLANGYWGKKSYHSADEELKQLQLAVQ
jgi:hypothetical protein